MPVTKKIDMAAWQTNYKDGTSRAGSKLVTKFNSRTGIVDAATSAAAVELMKTRVVSDLAIAKRNFKLRRQGDQGLHDAMTRTGSSAYVSQTAAKAAKAAAGFAPFAPVLESLTNALPARVDDPAANVTNRVTPIAVGLRNAAKSIYGTA